MALIDEYKQAIQDVLDGRMKEAPRPSELPWTEDKAATMWAAAAAELIAEANGGDALPDTPGTDGTYALQNTVSSGTGTLSWASGSSGGVLVVEFTYDPDTGNAVGNKTCKEVWDAYIAGSCVLFNKIFIDNDYAKPIHGNIENGTYAFLIYNPFSGSYVEATGEANDNIYACLDD